MNPSFDLAPPSRAPRLWLFALAVALPAAIAAIALVSGSAEEALQALDSGGGVAWSTAGAGVVVWVLVLWWFLDRMMRRHRLRLEGGRLRVQTSFYSVDLGLEELKLEQARVVDLEERTEFRPVLKTNGYALPGFKSGHFRLRSGDKAFVAIAGERRALWLPTTRREALLLQPRQPDALLSHLRELAAAPPRR